MTRSRLRAASYFALPLLLPAVPAAAQTGTGAAQNGPTQNADTQAAPAQTPPAETTGPQDAAAKASQEPTPAAPTQNGRVIAEGGAQVADIIVTAEKRSVSLQKAPAAITVADGQTLVQRGIEGINQVQNLLPSARISPSAAGGAQIFIRGVGQKTDSPNADALAVANFNGIGVLREALGGSSLFDVDRIEVLPGPQGTLYGSTAIAGVVNIEFNKPGQKPEAIVQVEQGNYDSTRVTGAVNLPVGPTAAVRLAGNYDKEGSFLTSGAGAIDDLGLRLSGKVDLASNLSVFAFGSYTQSRGTSPGFIFYPFINPNDKLNDRLGPTGPTAPFVGPLHDNLYIAGGKVEYDAGPVTITYLPGYEKYDSNRSFYFAGNGFYITEHVRQYSNELRFANATGSRLQFVGGLFQQSSEYLNYQALRNTAVNVSVPLSRLSSVSGYAQGTYSITDALRATVGARYGTDKRTALANEASQRGIIIGQFSFARRYDHADFKGGLEWDVRPDSLAYAVVQTGYAPGTYSATPSLAATDPSVQPALKPSRLISYTAGLKNRFFNRRLTFNVEAYHYDYRNLFVSAINALTGRNLFYNAGRIEIYGAQVDSALAIGRNTEVHGTVGYLHARNTDFVIPQAASLAPISYNGLAPTSSPTWTGNIGASQVFPIESGGKFTLRADSHIESSSYGAFDYRPGTTDIGLSTRNPAFTRTDASFTFEPAGGRFHIGAYVRNIENTIRVGVLSGITSTLAQGILERPRTYGIEVGLRY